MTTTATMAATFPETSSSEETRYAELQTLTLDAAREADDVFLSSVLEAGMPIDLSDHKGNSLLMLAAYHGHPSTVKLLLAHGADIDRRNARQQTPLGGVAFKGDVDIAKLLLEAGAETNADQGNGITPFLLATMFGRSEVADLLAAQQSSAPLHSFRSRLFAKLMGSAVRVWRRLRRGGFLKLGS